MSRLVEVLNVKIKRNRIDAARVPKLKEIFGLDELPLATCEVEIEINGVPTAVVNALRRTITDEMLGYALKVPADGYDTALTTDRFMIQQYVESQISLARLKPHISSELKRSLRLELDVHNDDVIPKVVYMGDLVPTSGVLPDDLFNPTTAIAIIQPGKRLVVKNIYISSGYGRDSSIYNVACRAAFTHLDIEQYSKQEQTEENGAAVEQSGYKLSSSVANPRHHLLTATLPAVNSNPKEVRTVFSDACIIIKEKLKLVLSSIEGMKVFTTTQGKNEGSIQIMGESYTIGELVKRILFENNEDVYVNYTVIPRDNKLVMKIRSQADIIEILSGAIHTAITIFDVIQQGVMTA